MAEILQFPGKKAAPELEPAPRQEFTRAPRPNRVQEVVDSPAVQGALNRIQVGRYAAILPDVTDQHNAIEALIAAAQFYAVGGVDSGTRARKALEKFQQAVSESTPQPPSAA